MSYIRSFPLLIIPILLYNLIVWASPWSADDVLECTEIVGRPVHPLTCQLDVSIVHLPMTSSMVFADTGLEEQLFWAVTLSDGILVLSLVFLFAELLKSTGVGAASITNHALSLLVFVLGLVEFLMFPAFATSLFFLVTLMALLDVLAGFIVTIMAARRDVTFGP